MKVIPPEPAPKVTDTADADPNEQTTEPAPPADADGDGIVAGDKCPDAKETANGFEDDDGCPDELPAVYLAGDTLKLKEAIVFAAFGLVSSKSGPMLDGVAKVMADHPEVGKLEVGGHVWGGKDNARTSRTRASAVVEALTKRGVAKERLVATGHGNKCHKSKPHPGGIGTGDAKERVKIAFVVAERGGKATGATSGCN